MPKIVNIHEAKTHLSRLLARVLAGEEILIAKAGQPIARLVRLSEAPHPRIPGTARGKISIGPDFQEPLPDQVLESFQA